jgi:hypothetical protein
MDDNYHNFIKNNQEVIRDIERILYNIAENKILTKINKFEEQEIFKINKCNDDLEKELCQKLKTCKIK